MSYLRFQHVFVGLMGLSALSAFAIPARYIYRVEPNVQSVFAPVARPVGWVARKVRNRIAPQTSPDRRKIDDVRHENELLTAELANRTLQLQDLSVRYAEKIKMGPIAQFCTPCSVVGPDSGGRESLNVSASTLDGVREEMYVVYPGGMVGQIERSGIAGAQVRLITDPSFRVLASFWKPAPDEDGKPQFIRLGTNAVVAEGAGKGAMVARALTMNAVKEHGFVNRAGEIDGPILALLEDPDCPRSLKGRVLGRVTRISPRRDARQYAEIRIEPTDNLMRLSEVMVLTKDK